MTCFSLKSAKTPYKTKQPLSNFQAHFGKMRKQLQAEIENRVAYKKKCTLMSKILEIGQNGEALKDIPP